MERLKTNVGIRQSCRVWLFYRRSQTAANRRIVHQPDCVAKLEDELQVKLLNHPAHAALGSPKLEKSIMGCRRMLHEVQDVLKQLLRF